MPAVRTHGKRAARTRVRYAIGLREPNGEMRALTTNAYMRMITGEDHCDLTSCLSDMQLFRDDVTAKLALAEILRHSRDVPWDILRIEVPPPPAPFMIRWNSELIKANTEAEARRALLDAVADWVIDEIGEQGAGLAELRRPDGSRQWFRFKCTAVELDRDRDALQVELDAPADAPGGAS